MHTHIKAYTVHEYSKDQKKDTHVRQREGGKERGREGKREEGRRQRGKGPGSFVLTKVFFLAKYSLLSSSD